MTNRTDQITALILAGGRATRMGGNDKGLLLLGGQAFVGHLSDQIARQVHTVLVNANRNHDRYREMGYDIVQDASETFQGPLAGMWAGLRTMKTPWLITLPCDGPFLSANYAHRMFTTAMEDGNKLAVASDGTRLQPVYALIHRTLEESLQQFLLSDDRKIDRWFAQHSYSTVLFADSPNMFTNVNTPEELEHLRRAHKKNDGLKSAGPRRRG